jgi:hypothetical protein
MVGPLRQFHEAFSELLDIPSIVARRHYDANRMIGILCMPARSGPHEAGAGNPGDGALAGIDMLREVAGNFSIVFLQSSGQWHLVDRQALHDRQGKMT